MDPSAVSFKPGDIVIIEDVHRRDAFFRHKRLIVDEICVYVGSPSYPYKEEGGYVGAIVCPVFPGEHSGDLFFRAVKLRHFFN